MQGERCNPSPECKYFYSETGCFEDVDHYYFPKHNYKTATERQFRRLPENLIEGCRRIHEERHFTEEPPDKPTLEFMRQAILKHRDET